MRIGAFQPSLIEEGILRCIQEQNPNASSQGIPAMLVDATMKGKK
jgi:hypothetical protein